ncbi:MAG: hypothetical protein J0I06_13760 [Planctomycetes bacterium]|nr:hypothetical protein [Planctomycetota bacterium]
MTFRCLIVALALALVATDSKAGPFRRRAQTVYQQPSYTLHAAAPVAPVSGYTLESAPLVMPAGGATAASTSVVTSPDVTSGPVALSAEVGDGLDEVNAKRAARGLRPFVRDEGLTQAARSCAAFRAERGLFGHTSNDFAFVPPGAAASSAGCAAYPVSYGWMSCCVYDNHTYAGAAWVTGRDGRRYMHLFVR